MTSGAGSSTRAKMPSSIDALNAKKRPKMDTPIQARAVPNNKNAKVKNKAEVASLRFIKTPL